MTDVNEDWEQQRADYRLIQDGFCNGSMSKDDTIKSLRRLGFVDYEIALEVSLLEYERKMIQLGGVRLRAPG